MPATSPCNAEYDRARRPAARSVILQPPLKGPRPAVAAATLASAFRKRDPPHAASECYERFDSKGQRRFVDAKLGAVPGMHGTRSFFADAVPNQ